MIRCLLYLLLLLLPVLASSQKVLLIEVDGSINPVTADYIQRGIDKAVEEKSVCLILKLNTPGGLLKSTRVIVSSILEAPLPVVVYVSPNGAHAGSAGVFITMAGHIAAMVPGSNIGAAHPVSGQQQMDSIMSEKVTNDAAAFIRSIAQNRNRDTAWAEMAVRKSVSITAREALEKNVIDLLATDVNELLRKIDGKTVTVRSNTVELKTLNATVVVEPMTWFEKFLNIIVDPSIAYILMTIGFLGIVMELYNPGVIFPGVLGGISLILAFYAMHTLPINYAGLALIILAIILFILEIHIVSHGVLSIGGVIALLLGSFMLMKNESPLEFVRISKAVIIPVVVVVAAFFLWMVTLAVNAQRRNKHITGGESLTGSTGVAMEDFDTEGMILLQGELWKAATTASIQKGQQVKIIGRRNLTLLIESI